MRFVDRSRIETSDRCPRERYWGYEFNGRGISPEGRSIDLSYGLAFHEGAEILVKGGSLDEALLAGNAQLEGCATLTPEGYTQRTEYGALLYGHLRAFREYHLPKLLDRFEILHIEEEMAIPLAPWLLYGTRLDLAVRDRETKIAYNYSYKTDKDPSDIFYRMFYHIQNLLEAATLSTALGGEEVGGTIVLGIDKGDKRSVTAKEKENGLFGDRRLSPFTYAFRKKGTFGGDIVSLEWKNGWERFPVWLEGADKWWSFLTVEHEFDPSSIFVETPPIPFDPVLYESVLLQIRTKEAALSEGVALMKNRPENTLNWRDMYFPQDFTQCRNSGGYHKQCWAIDLCHGCHALSPESWGYVPREINHPIEETLMMEVGG